MSTDPDQIRADIARTRAELSNDVDALEEKVSPSAIVQRRKQDVRSRVGSVKQRVMGSAQGTTSSLSSGGHTAKDKTSDALHGAKDSVGSAAHSVGHTAKELPGTVKHQAEGNPFAAGLVAFGVGWLAGSLLPVSEKEKRAAAQAKEKAEPLVEGAKEKAKEVAQELKEPAQDAAQAVKGKATEAADHLKSEGRSEAEGVKQDAHSAKDTVQGEAQQRVEEQRSS
ncbi:hypothetical protein N866_13025 [Actinotalea ferrariae CF5-4]|uniref:DUF3618 domain-containing protein n=1 Tax=Actinotalea ferrariae CF5-4 TaxID=948458 RepID=A0A021VYL9_9CELL|nr:DUF3618 domain-containing protein [Actinotalea ferrariae]EYR65105.1 hypothetical protein N866_13025 [Actinotalea ferrariae CF5-4]